MQNRKQYLIVFFGLYFINPIFGIIALIIHITKFKKIEYHYYYTLILMISFYLGLIVMTIKPESDLLEYRESFCMASNMGFINYLVLYGKELLFYSFTYILYYAFGGMFNLYILFIVSLGYLLLLKSIIDYYEVHIDNGSFVALYAIVFISFFELYFNWTGHLVLF